MSDSESFLRTFIDTQRKAIKYHVVFALIVFSLGLIMLIVTFVLLQDKESESLKAVISIGGGFISSISAFPIREIINRKERISAFKSVQLLLQSSDKHERGKVEELIWKTIENTVLG